MKTTTKTQYQGGEMPEITRVRNKAIAQRLIVEYYTCKLIKDMPDWIRYRMIESGKLAHRLYYGGGYDKIR